MMSVGDVFICLVVGLAIPLAILDAARTMLERLPEQGTGFQIERRWTPWLLATFAGPALMFDRVAEGWREGAYSRGDILSGALITAGWAMIYGFLVLKIVHFLGA